jgi:hypothetical protein
MLDRVVRYLRSCDVSFKLVSEAAPEPKPAVAPPVLAPGGNLLATEVVLVDGRVGIACVREGERIDLAALGAELGAGVVAGSSADLPAPYTDAHEPIPPLGHELHVPLFVDSSLVGSSVIGFRAFAETDWIEMAYDDFARLEQPRIASFGAAGDLPAHQAEKRVA